MNYPTLDSRLEAMIWGQFLGDALCLGTHWIYNLEDLNAFYPELRGFEKPRPGHYHHGKEPGDFTHYGEAALLLLESVAECQGLDVTDFGRRFVSTFGSTQYHGYLDSATRGTLEKVPRDADGRVSADFAFQNGADDDQLATATSLAPVVAFYHQSAELDEQITRLTRVRQNHPRSIAYMKLHGRLLARLLAGVDLHSAVHQVQEDVSKDSDFGNELAIRFKEVFAKKHLTTIEATAQLGQSCPLKNSFPSALVAVIQTPDDFEGTLRRILAAGGDNAGRAAMAGAWLGAHLGMEKVPSAWCEKLRHRERIHTAIDKILGGQRLS